MEDGVKEILGFGNYFQHVKKNPQFLRLIWYEVAQARIFNFGFYCKPCLFLKTKLEKLENNVEVEDQMTGHPVFQEKGWNRSRDF